MASRPTRRGLEPEPDESPFTEDDLAEMTRRLQELDKADRIIQRASRGGINVETLQSTSRELREQLTKLKNAFFPGR
jgi:hypothetical protein